MSSSSTSPTPSSPLPRNIHVSTHPCLRAKLSQLRSKDASARESKALVHDIALILGCEALASTLRTVSRGTNETPLGYTYTTETISPHVVLVPILRSGLGMLEALQALLPTPVPVHHLGLFREPSTLAPVEYYNNLPHHSPSSLNSTPASASASASSVPEIAILVDPVIATGGTAVAAIQTLLEWGVRKVVMICVLGSEGGVRRAAREGEAGGSGGAGAAASAADSSSGGIGSGGTGTAEEQEQEQEQENKDEGANARASQKQTKADDDQSATVEIWVGGLDPECDARGMIRPGLGDVGDRLFLTRGK